VTIPEAEFQPPVTTASGAVVRRPVKPQEYEVAASASCERTVATFHDGREPAQDTIVIPPAPGLRAEAISERTVRVSWWFERLPDDCRPAIILIAVIANDATDALPWMEEVSVTAPEGTALPTYPEFAPAPPDVATASAYTADGLRSRTVRVLISRGRAKVPNSEAG
jgi:hypothetical protein